MVLLLIALQLLQIVLTRNTDCSKALQMRIINLSVEPCTTGSKKMSRKLNKR